MHRGTAPKESFKLGLGREPLDRDSRNHWASLRSGEDRRWLTVVLEGDLADLVERRWQAQLFEKNDHCTWTTRPTKRIPGQFLGKRKGLAAPASANP